MSSQDVLGGKSVTGVWDTLQRAGKLVGKAACSALEHTRHMQELACASSGLIMFCFSPPQWLDFQSRATRESLASPLPLLKDEWQRRSALLAFGALQALQRLSSGGFSYCPLVMLFGVPEACSSWTSLCDHFGRMELVFQLRHFRRRLQKLKVKCRS